MLAPIARSVLKFMPVGLSVATTTYLAARPVRSRLKARDRAALEKARPMLWGPEHRHLAWSWGHGPLVVLVHGWHGRAVQMASLARHLAAQGFRCVAPDMSAHGESPGTHIRFDQFVADLAQLLDDLRDPVHTLIGHSAGGLTMMAARTVSQVRASNYVCLNAPRAPYPPIRGIREALNPGERVLKRCAAYYASQFAFDRHTLDRGGAYCYYGSGRLMLVYDHDDLRIDIGDADIVSQRWPGCEILRTAGLGHQRTLWNEAVLHAVGAFITRSSASRHDYRSRSSVPRPTNETCPIT